VRGFDLFEEKDPGRSLLFYMDSLLEAERENDNTFNFDLRVAETNWPEDFEPVCARDSVSLLNNLYDAVFLKSRRVGHGLGLIKHPELYAHFRDNQVAVEVCPSSNKILGFDLIHFDTVVEKNALTNIK
jgi:adenosine deaminase CECR1